jgi:hypothetical protein
MSFSVTNQEYFETNSAVQSANTRNKYHLMNQLSNSRHVFRKVFINILNNLPCSLISLIDEKAEFKIPLKSCLNMHSLHSIDKVLLLTNYSQSSLAFIYVGTAPVQIHHAVLPTIDLTFIKYTHSLLAALVTHTLSSIYSGYILCCI